MSQTRQSSRANKWIFSVLAIASIGLCWLVIPRGEISGEAASAPSSWEFVGDDHPCILETSTTARRSVRVGCYSIDGRLHVHSHRWTERPPLFGTSWVAEVARNPVVRIQIDGAVYTLRANEVLDSNERRRILVARGHDPVPTGMRLFWFSPVDRRAGQ